MSRLEETRHLVASAEYPYVTSNIKAAPVRILDHLIAQEQAAKKPQSAEFTEEMANEWVAWEELQRERYALRAELDTANAAVTHWQEVAKKYEDRYFAAKARIAELEGNRDDTRFWQLDAALTRLNVLEAYKARVEALPVRTYSEVDAKSILSVSLKTEPQYGRFIPAEGD